MSEFRWIRLEASEDGVRTLTLDRPPVNALGKELVEDLAAAFKSVREDDGSRCLVVRSAAKHFCAGADLKERREMSVEEARGFVARLSSVIRQLGDLPVPVIAAVRGAAAGGGCEVALACDLRVLADDATMGLRETALAILPGAGGTQRLPRIIGPARAKRWILTAKMHTAQEALADGVADRVVPASCLDEEALCLAQAIAANGPVAIRLAKKAIDDGLGLPLPQALDLEWERYQETLDTEDRIEALQAFAEKRPPRFRGR